MVFVRRLNPRVTQRRTRGHASLIVASSTSASRLFPVRRIDRQMRLRTLAFLAASILAVSAIALIVRSGPSGRPAADVAQSASSAIPSPNIALSPATLPYVGVQVVGKPRVAAKHPNVFWDQEDINHYKEMLQSSRELQIQFAELKRKMDEVVGQPVSIPEPQKGPDGQWLFPGDYFPRSLGRPTPPTLGRIFRLHMIKAADAVSDLGTVYVLTGDEKYAKHARDILVGYSNCSRYGPPKGMDKRSGKGLLGALFDQAMILQVITRGYDLISSSRSVSAEDRIRIHDELLRPLATEMVYPIAPELNIGSTVASEANNRAAMAAASVLLVGYATDDDELVERGALRHAFDAALFRPRASHAVSPAQGLDGRDRRQPEPWPLDGILRADRDFRGHVGRGQSQLRAVCPWIVDQCGRSGVASRPRSLLV